MLIGSAWTGQRGEVRPAVDRRPLAVHALGTLQVAGGGRILDAASGLAAVGGTAWIVSDGDHDLLRFDDLARAGARVNGLPERADKYDLEALTTLPNAGAGRGAALLAVGSGSKAGRDLGVLQDVDAAGAPAGPAMAVQLGPLYAALDDRLPDQLNVEGAAVRHGRSGWELLLFHRGLEPGSKSVVFVLDADAVARAARAGRAVAATAVRSQRVLELGALDGHQLAVSDADVLPDGRIVITATAETTDEAHRDGRIIGSAVGVLSSDLRLESLRPLTGPPRKVEGIEPARSFDPSAPADRYVLVTDADDKTRPSELLHVEL